jgi:hypothetical protein
LLFLAQKIFLQITKIKVPEKIKHLEGVQATKLIEGKTSEEIVKIEDVAPEGLV